MTKKDVETLLDILTDYYPDAKCSLNFNSPFELVIAVMLSAQCTDERVNKITPELFSKYNTPHHFVDLDVDLIGQIIKPCGFYRTKANNIKKTAIMLCEQYNGIVPQSMQELMKLPGIWRKSANVIMLEAFDNPQGIAVDTHAKRISNRLGLSKSSDPLIIEQDLLKKIPKKYYSKINHLFIWHGRSICKAPTPNCEICPIKEYCKYYKTKKK